MKNKIKKLMLLCIVFISCGCVKFNANMEIKNNKKMNFEVIYALDTSMFGDEELLNAENKDNLIKKGYKVKDYQDGKMKGFTISMNVKNIDKVSSKDAINYNLSGIIDDNDQSKKMFQVKKGLFKNTYIANFKFDTMDSGIDATDEELDNGNEEDFESFNNIIDNMQSNLNLSFNLKVPFKVISSNATKTDNNNKELNWSLLRGESDIKFSFYLYNISTIIAILIIILIGFGFIILNKKNKIKKNIDVDNHVDEVINVESQMQTPIKEELVNSNVVNTPLVENKEIENQIKQENENLVNNNFNFMQQNTNEGIEKTKLDSNFINSTAMNVPPSLNETEVIKNDDIQNISEPKIENKLESNPLDIFTSTPTLENEQVQQMNDNNL